MPGALHALEEHVTADVTLGLAEDVGAGDLTTQLVPDLHKAKSPLLTQRRDPLRHQVDQQHL